MTEMPQKHFLLVFDPATGSAANVREFNHAAAALDAYRDTEQQFRGRPEIQVVLIGADSLETVKKTHSNYFDDSSIQGIKSEIRRQTRRTAV